MVVDDPPDTPDRTAALYPELWEDVSALGMPILLALGSRSKVVDDVDRTELLHRQPTARVVTIDGAGHRVQGDRPVELARVLATFLEVALIVSGDRVSGLATGPTDASRDADRSRSVDHLATYGLTVAWVGKELRPLQLHIVRALGTDQLPSFRKVHCRNEPLAAVALSPSRGHR